MGDEVLPTKCDDWSLNKDEGGKKFWWNKTYNLSIWATSLKTKGDDAIQTDDTVWKAFVEYQISAVYKMCTWCNGPEGNDDMLVCCYCGNHFHPTTCSKPATAAQMAWKSANAGFEGSLVCCFACDDEESGKEKPTIVKHEDDARRAVKRALTQGDEIPAAQKQQLNRILKAFDQKKKAGELTLKDKESMMDQVQRTVATYFQPHETSDMLVRQPIESKCGGWGIVATRDIPPYTIVGVYPGYEDPLSGEQLKLNRPSPKYSLVDLNCADYWNRVFSEFQKCFTPFINEPTPTEKSNTAWIQETTRPEGRLSVMTVRKINAGEELLIGYGPLYPRDYPYNYDAYAYHLLDEYKDHETPCFALWHWKTTEEKDAEFDCYVGYDKETDSYAYWETEEEQKERLAKKKAAENNNGESSTNSSAQ